MRSGFCDNFRRKDEQLARGANWRTTNEELSQKTKQKMSSYFLTAPKEASTVFSPISAYETITRVGFTLGYHMINKKRSKNDEAQFALYERIETHQVPKQPVFNLNDVLKDLAAHNTRETLKLIAVLKVGPNGRPASHTHSFGNDKYLAALECFEGF